MMASWLRAIVSGTPAQRAVDATLADWRHERAAATTPLGRLVISARSTMALIRVIALAGVAECPRVLKGSLLPRLAAAMAALVVIAWLAGLSFVDDRFFLVASPLEVWGIAAASIAGQVSIVFPIVVFVAEVMGRRSRETRIRDSLAVLVVLGSIMILLVVPSTVWFIRYERWWYFGNGSQHAPSLRAAWLGQHLVTGALISSIFTVVLFLLANGIRRVGGVAGWTVGLGPALVVFVSLLVVRLTLLPFDGRVAVLLALPLAIAAALIWSVVLLSRIAAARSASAPPSPQIAK